MLHQTTKAFQLNGLAASRAFFEPAVASDHRSLHVAHVDEEGRCLHLSRYPEQVRNGLPASAIIRDAAELGSAGIVLAHRDDDEAPPAQVQGWPETRMLADAVELIQVTLLDHLVFHNRDCLSLRRVGVL